MSKYRFHIQNPSIYPFQWDLLHLLVCYIGMRYVSTQETILYERFQTLAVHLFWTVNVSGHMVSTLCI